MRPVLSGRTDLALQVLRLLAADGQRHKASALAEVIGTTPGYLPQVLHPLIRAGWVASTAGPHGGYELVVSRDQLNLLEVIEAIEGPLEQGRCVLRPQECPGQTPCVLHEPWSRARTALLEELRSTPIDQPRAQVPASVAPDPALFGHEQATSP